MRANAVTAKLTSYAMKSPAGQYTALFFGTGSPPQSTSPSFSYGKMSRTGENLICARSNTARQ